MVDCCKNQVNNLGKDQLVQCTTTITDESRTIYNYVIYIYIVDWGGFGHGVNSDGIRNVGAI